MNTILLLYQQENKEEFEITDKEITVYSSIFGIGKVNVFLSNSKLALGGSTFIANLKIICENSQISSSFVSSNGFSCPTVFQNCVIIGYRASNNKEKGSKGLLKYDEKDRKLSIDSDLIGLYREMQQASSKSFHGPPITCNAGELVLSNCIITSPLGGGPLATGIDNQKPVLYIANCEISNCSLAGIEAREGGSVICYQSSIHHNKNGILVWKKARNVLIVKCEIHDNENEGIMVDTPFSFHKTNARLLHNKVFRNGTFGISASSYESIQIIGNEVNDNRSWAIFLQRPRGTLIWGNNVHHNESGGVHVLMVEFKDTLVLKNSIHHNNGPPINHVEMSYGATPFQLYPEEKFKKPVTLLDNQCFNNLDRIQFKCDDKILICSNCKSDQNLQFCSKCRQVRYCSRSCQQNHWKVHKVFCNFFKVNFLHKITLLDPQKPNVIYLNQISMFNKIEATNLNHFWENVRSGKKNLVQNTIWFTSRNYQQKRQRRKKVS